jgi:hypothetical protein
LDVEEGQRAKGRGTRENRRAEGQGQRDKREQKGRGTRENTNDTKDKEMMNIEQGMMKLEVKTRIPWTHAIMDSSLHHSKFRANCELGTVNSEL